MYIKIMTRRTRLFSGNVPVDAINTIVKYAETNQLTKSTNETVSKVCDYFRVTPDELATRSRSHEMVMPRAIIYYRLVVIEEYTLREAGALFGRNHATVVSGIKRARKYYKKAYFNIFKEEIK